MEIVEDDEFRRKLIEELINGEREGIHVTDLIYCLRKAYYRKKGVKGEVDENRILAMTVGKGAHTILETGYFNEIPVEKDGIRGTIDLIKDTIVEIKTTRFNLGIKEPWIRQIKSYLAMTGKNVARIVVVDVARNTMKVYRLYFTDEEIKEHWNWMLARKEILKLSLLKDNPPPGPEYDWECRFCEYRNICKGQTRLEKVFDCDRR